jgi:YD repeat-containing protein
VRSGAAGVVAIGLLGAGCGGSAAGDSPTEGTPACRTYAAAYNRVVSSGTSFDITCTHADGDAGFDRTCLGYDAPTMEHWASKADFIHEAAAVGIIRELTFTTGASTLTFEYDPLNRPQRRSSTDGVDVRYDFWDPLGRPTHQITVAGDCPGAEISIGYGSATIDDTVIAGMPCARNAVYGYDSDDNPSSVDYGDGDGKSTRRRVARPSAAEREEGARQPAVSVATASTCFVCGNMSNGCTRRHA